MAVDVVVRDVAVGAPADEVGEGADRPDIRGFVEPEAVPGIEALPRADLLADRGQRGIAAGACAGGGVTAFLMGTT